MPVSWSDIVGVDSVGRLLNHNIQKMLPPSWDYHWLSHLPLRLAVDNIVKWRDKVILTILETHGVGYMNKSGLLLFHSHMSRIVPDWWTTRGRFTFSIEFILVHVTLHRIRDHNS